MTASPPIWHRFTMGDGSWGFTDASGRPVLTVSALGGGQIAIDCDVTVLSWARKVLPRPDQVTEQGGVTRLLYRGKYTA
jgi:hypothetical protein